MSKEISSIGTLCSSINLLNRHIIKFSFLHIFGYPVRPLYDLILWANQKCSLDTVFKAVNLRKFYMWIRKRVLVHWWIVLKSVTGIVTWFIVFQDRDLDISSVPILKWPIHTVLVFAIIVFWESWHKRSVILP